MKEKKLKLVMETPSKSLKESGHHEKMAEEEKKSEKGKDNSIHKLKR